MSNTILVLEHQVDDARYLYRKLQEDGNTAHILPNFGSVSSTLAANLPLAESIDILLINVQSLVGDDPAYKGYGYDFDAMLASIGIMQRMLPNLKLIGVYATINNRAMDIVIELYNQNHPAIFLDYCKPADFDKVSEATDPTTLVKAPPVKVCGGL